MNLLDQLTFEHLKILRSAPRARLRRAVQRFLQEKEMYNLNARVKARLLQKLSTIALERELKRAWHLVKRGLNLPG